MAKCKKTSKSKCEQIATHGDQVEAASIFLMGWRRWASYLDSSAGNSEIDSDNSFLYGRGENTSQELALPVPCIRQHTNTTKLIIKSLQGLHGYKKLVILCRFQKCELIGTLVTKCT